MADMKNVKSPDETRTFENGKVELFNVGGGTVGLFTLQPGWQWSKHVKPLVGGDWCMQNHFGYQLSGRMRFRTQDGAESELGPGDIGVIPPGHDAWVVGNEPCVTIDWSGAATYAKR